MLDKSLRGHQDHHQVQVAVLRQTQVVLRLALVVGQEKEAQVADNQHLHQVQQMILLQIHQQIQHQVHQLLQTMGILKTLIMV